QLALDRRNTVVPAKAVRTHVYDPALGMERQHTRPVWYPEIWVRERAHRNRCGHQRIASGKKIPSNQNTTHTTTSTFTMFLIFGSIGMMAFTAHSKTPMMMSVTMTESMVF